MTMHELYVKHGPALGCTYFSEFCIVWPKVCALLDARAKVEFFGDNKKWVPSMVWMPSTIKGCMLDICERCEGPQNQWGFAGVRVVLLDGTVIREWPAKETIQLRVCRNKL